MNLKYEKSYSTERPEIIDSTSSQTTIYIRTNIIFHEDENLFEYDEAKLTPEEYEEYLTELKLIDIQQQRADIDYIALMNGIDLGEY